MTTVTNPDYSARLRRCATVLGEQGVDGFIQPTNDRFMSEYPPESAARLRWLCGFSGSAGAALILREAIEGRQGVLFTDGRYTVQARRQVNEKDYRMMNSTQQAPEAWLKANQSAPFRFGFDPWLHTAQEVARWRQALANTPIALQPLASNPVDALWTDRPAEPSGAVRAHPLELAGEASAAKRARLAAELKAQGAAAALLCLPDGINWLLNIRGEDIAYNPLVLGMALLHDDARVTLFLNGAARPPFDYGEGVQVRAMHDLEREAAAIFGALGAVRFDPATSAEWLRQRLEESGARIIEGQDVTLLPKACKNAIEIEGMRAAHRRDGRALTMFLRWFEAESARRGVGEIEAEEMLEAFRRREGGEYYRGPSFATIAGSGPHGAIVHYRATPQSDRQAQPGELFLLDSGGQYLDGTTDVTRTLAVGVASAEMIDRFTRVLKGHIALATARFPQGTSGRQLDALARQFLWTAGCDYDHGTGHGVGAFLCVHEGPQRIAKKGSDVPLLPGMILSNEPGYYKDDCYGIRIENLVLVVEDAQAGWLCFEALTLAPIDERLIDHAMLTDAERDWLDRYQARVLENMSS